MDRLVEVARVSQVALLVVEPVVVVKSDSMLPSGKSGGSGKLGKLGKFMPDGNVNARHVPAWQSDS